MERDLSLLRAGRRLVPPAGATSARPPLARGEPPEPVPGRPPSMPTCASCNESVSPGATYCGACGARLPPDPAAEQVDPFIGQTLGDVYVIRERIGSGGMGDVYKAIHRTLDAPVAVKIV